MPTLSTGEKGWAFGDDHGCTKYPMREFLEAIEELESPTAPAITEEVGCSPKTTYFRLDRLEEEGYIQRERDGEPHTIELVDQ